MSETYYPRFPPISCLDDERDKELDALKAENERLRDEVERLKVEREELLARIGRMAEA